MPLEIPHEVFEKNGQSYIRYFTLNSFQNCSVDDPMKTYKEIMRNGRGKHYNRAVEQTKSGREYVMWHLCQNFSAGVDPVTANEIGRRLAEEVFKGYAVTVSTHTNTGKIHNHFIISAWNLDGGKWNNCNTSYRNIRSVSDRLCDEYGLKVLDKTREQKLITYKDADGKPRRFEPTDRKIELIRKREAGEISKDDAGSYRNTSGYEQAAGLKGSNRDDIKRDIDALLPEVKTYDELIYRLREIGYTVNDKKKNGDWLSHISFQAPTHDKATRDSMLGDKEFYKREHLTAYIAKSKSPHREDNMRPPVSVPFFEQYDYGTTELAEISEDWRRTPGNTVVPRTESEKMVIADVRKADLEVTGLIDTTRLHQIIAEQKTAAREKRPYRAKTREEQLVQQIQDSFRCLRTIEEHRIHSTRQILGLYRDCLNGQGGRDRLSELENCMRTFHRIDSQRGVGDEGLMKEFNMISGQANPAVKKKHRDGR